jgi:hypothetical protein
VSAVHKLYKKKNDINSSSSTTARIENWHSPSARLYILVKVRRRSRWEVMVEVMPKEIRQSFSTIQCPLAKTLISHPSPPLINSLELLTQANTSGSCLLQPKTKKASQDHQRMALMDRTIERRIHTDWNLLLFSCLNLCIFSYLTSYMARPMVANQRAQCVCALLADQE